MIRKARADEKQIIYKIWKDTFTHDDFGYTDYYFENVFVCDNTYVKEVDGKIVSTIQRNPHQMMFNGKVINTSMILGVTTLEAYRKQGHMRELMQYVLAIVDKEELFTLIQAYEPRIYKPFGFQMVYYRNRLSYDSNKIARYENLKLDENFTCSQLANVYSEFTKKFNAYYIRDEAYYELYLKEVVAEDGKIIAYHNDKNELEGYMVYYLSEDTCDIREIVYLNSWAFLGLVAYGANLKPKICVHTSSYEKIQKILVNGSIKEYPFAMVRINDYSLFNIYFEQVIQNPEEAFCVSEIPLFLHEYA